MSDASSFAQLPAPPYYAVIFTSKRTLTDEGYGDVATRMVELAAQQPGFLGVESSRDAGGFGITVSYWRDEAAIRSWKMQTDHQTAQQGGRSTWYKHFEVRIARVERAYGFGQHDSPSLANEK